MKLAGIIVEYNTKAGEVDRALLDIQLPAEELDQASCRATIESVSVIIAIKDNEPTGDVRVDPTKGIASIFDAILGAQLDVQCTAFCVAKRSALYVAKCSSALICGIQAADLNASYGAQRIAFISAFRCTQLNVQ